MAVWKITGGAYTDATLLSLGLSGLTRTRRNMARDEVSFDHEGAAIDSSALFAIGSQVTLKRDTTIWFVGVVVEIPRRGAQEMESISYRVAGVWWYFENLVYQQIWPLDAAANSHLTSPTTYRRALAIVGLLPTTNLRQNTKDFIVDVLSYIVGASGSPPTQYTAGELPTGFNVPFTRLDSPTCAEALRWVTRWIADAVVWFDYSVSPPKFNMHRRSGASTLAFTLTDLEQFQVTPRSELKIDNLVIQFVTVNGAGKVVLNEDKDPSGATGKEWGSAVFTIDNNYQPLPTGLAANFRAGLSTLQYSGRAVITEEECSQSVRPGHLINVTGGAAEWSTMNAQVQEVIEDVDAGRTSIVFGPPNHIRLDDLLEILRLARNQSDQFGGYTEILKVGSRGRNPQVLTKDINPAGNVPTATEIATGIEQAYSGNPAPRIDDVVDITVDSALRYTAFVHSYSAGVSGGAFIVGFTVGGVTNYAHVFRTGTLRRITQALTVAGAVPTASEISTGIQTAFTSTARPQDGDIVLLTRSGVVKFVATVDSRLITASGLYVVGFTLGGITYYASVVQAGLYA